MILYSVTESDRTVLNDKIKCKESDRTVLNDNIKCNGI